MGSRLGIFLYVVALVVGVPVLLFGGAMIFVSPVADGKMAAGAIALAGLVVIGLGWGMRFLLAGR